MEKIKQLGKENKKNLIIEFLWFCSGANIDILRCCPTDYAKYFGIGGTILFTALMASFAGGYAFFTAFKESIYQLVPASQEIVNGVVSTIPERKVLVGYTNGSYILSIIFGIFWGSMIFNLDRYIVVTLGKGDGTPKITKGELLSATPRLIMAILIGFVIATPLELKLFENEINVEIESLINEEVEKLGTADSTILLEKSKLEREKIDLNARKDKINAGNYDVLPDQQIKDINSQLIEKRNEQARQLKRIIPLHIAKSSQDSLRIKNNNRPVQALIAKLGAEINDLEGQLKENKGTSIAIKNQELNKIELRLTEISEGLRAINTTVQVKTIERESVAKQYNGFMARIEAYERLQNKHFSLRVVGIFITLLFIFIEVAPVFFKMMTESGPYDDIYERIKHEVFVREKQKISDVNDIINCDIEIGTRKNQNRLNAEIKSNEELLNTIALAQAEIAKTAIEKWKNQEMKKAIENPESFIQANTSGSQFQ
jgi:hypothetical protein